MRHPLHHTRESYHGNRSCSCRVKRGPCATLCPIHVNCIMAPWQVFQLQSETRSMRHPLHHTRESYHGNRSCSCRVKRGPCATLCTKANEKLATPSGVTTPGQLRAVLGLDLFLPGLWPDLKMSWVSCV